MIRATVRTEGARTALQNVANGITREATNAIVQRVAGLVFAEAVAITPVRWFGQVRASWQFVPTESSVTIRNNSPIFRYLDQGTANQGTGFIYPRVKKFLFVALTRSAAAGWHAGLRRGIDYILTKKVRGIKPLFIIERLKARAGQLLKQEFKNYIRDLIRNPQSPPQPGLASSIPSVLNSQGPLATGLATGVPASLFNQPRIPFT